MAPASLIVVATILCVSIGPLASQARASEAFFETGDTGSSEEELHAILTTEATPPLLDRKPAIVETEESRAIRLAAVENENPRREQDSTGDSSER